MREDATLMQLVTTDWSPSLDQLTFSRPRFPDDEDEPVRTIIDEPYPQCMCVYVCGGPQLAAMRLPTSLRRLQPISNFDSTCEHFPFPPSLARRLTLRFRVVHSLLSIRPTWPNVTMSTSD